MNDNRIKLVDRLIETHIEMVTTLRVGLVQTILAAADAITESLRRNGTVYICGNGGSAADAQHIAGELIGKFEASRRALPAVALTTDTSVITSLANDVSYESVFARQVEALVSDGDILWAISTSGTSPNVVAAAGLARQKGARILAFTGLKDSPLEKLADVCLCALSRSTARSQEIHQLAYHIICKLVEQDFVNS